MASVPSKAATAKAVAEYLAAHSSNGSISGGQLYTALFMLLNVAKGNTFAHEGNLISCFVAGKLAAVAKVSKAGVITSLVDAAGNSLFIKSDLRVEQALSWAKSGKVQDAAPLYLTSKAARQAVAAGKLPEGWAP